MPSYEAIAATAECCRDMVYEAIKALAFAGVLTWVNRIVRERVRERDLFGQWVSRWRVLRTSNVYAFRDPNPAMASRPASKSESPPGTRNQDSLIVNAPSIDKAPPIDGLDAVGTNLSRSLRSLGEAIARRTIASMP